MALIELIARIDSMTDKNYSLDAFNRFFDHAAEKGLLKRNTAQSRKAATNKVLAVLEQSELADLRSIDLDQAFDRFQNLQGMQYKPDSLQVYLSRARTAVSDFISYVDNPSSFKSAKPQRASSKSNSEAGASKKKKPKQGVTEGDGTDLDKHHDSKHVIVPVPLRENLTVKITNLPVDLTPAEADRLAAIVKAYAVPTVK